MLKCVDALEKLEFHCVIQDVLCGYIFANYMLKLYTQTCVFSNILYLTNTWDISTSMLLEVSCLINDVV